VLPRAVLQLRWGVVQPVGHLTVNEDGEGSNPSAPANFSPPETPVAVAPLEALALKDCEKSHARTGIASENLTRRKAPVPSFSSSRPVQIQSLLNVVVNFASDSQSNALTACHAILIPQGGEACLARRQSNPMQDQIGASPRAGATGSSQTCPGVCG
jgi:hypothetical protein